MSPEAMMRKVRRASKSVVGGEDLLETLTSAPYVNAMKEAIDDEIPPVAAISQSLLDTHSDVVDLKAMPVRQFIGMAVRAILFSEGFEVMETGVRINGDPIFRSGSTYQVIADDDGDDFLVRFVNMLSPEELHELSRLVKAAI